VTLGLVLDLGEYERTYGLATGDGNARHAGDLARDVVTLAARGATVALPWVTFASVES
jgi:hypothetical protein